MNLKTRAMLYTVGLIAGTIAISLGVTYIGSVLTRDQVGWIMASVVGGVFIYLVYSMTLCQLEHQELLEKMKTPVDR